MKIYVFPMGEGQYRWKNQRKGQTRPEKSKLVTLLGLEQKEFEKITNDTENPRVLQITLAGLYTQK